jgi:serine/threonine protein kinase
LTPSDEGARSDLAEAEGSSRSPTEIRETIDWVKTWTQGSFGSLGRFQLRERLGDGGFGSVFRAYDPRLDRDVAVKVLKQTNPSERVMERFFREARAVARLDHPNIAAVYDSGFDEGRCWVAYQLVSGRPLWWYRHHHPIDVGTSARIVRALADALDHSHHLGVVHRDLKPGNIIIDDRGQPRLIDFGLARRSDLESDLTRDGAILGTPAYMSPEQAHGHSRQVDERTDVYSLGVIFYELLTGHHPDEPSTASSDQTPPPVVVTNLLRLARKTHFLNPTIPRPLQHICTKAMATDPSARHATARSLAEELDWWLEREHWRRDRLRLAVAGMAVGISLAVVLLITSRFVLPAEPARTEHRQDRVPVLTSTGGSVAEPKERLAPTPEHSSKPREQPRSAHSSRAERRLVGNRETHVYHWDDCFHVRNLAANNQAFLAGPAEAAEKRYKSCKDCRPPVMPPQASQPSPPPASDGNH